jgi:hypothetical protein
MQSRAPIVVLFLGLVAGSVAGWIAHRPDTSTESESSVREAAHANSASAPFAQSAEVKSSASALRPRINSSSADSHLATPTSGDTTSTSITAGGSLIGTGSSRANASIQGSPETAVASVQPPSLDDLHEAASVRCTFGPGNSGWWANGRLTPASAAWQGGPVDFQSINYDAGTAQMVGQVTHSPTDAVPVAVTLSDADVTFTGRATNGTLTIISVFSKFDNTGHHVAVMSLHDGKQQLDIAQFYGGCDSAQKLMNPTSQQGQ